MVDAGRGRRYRFGVFEADAGTGELRKHGVRIKLNSQPFAVLLMLLRRPGELVTREEIAKELWPDGTFVDFERGVNSAINRLREALGDVASNPRFVETLARKGYRFMVEVVEFGMDTRAVVEEVVPEVEEADVLSGILSAPADLPRDTHGVARTLFVLMQVMYVGFYVGALANLAEIEVLFGELGWPERWVIAMIVTAALLIPVRAFVISVVAFRAPGGRAKLLRVWPYLLVMDLAWALSPFLLLHHINFGLALACTTLLVYSPFAQRGLVLMQGAGERV